jgi:glycosyltransferase involved in cell wall biosynthesis
MRLLALTHTFPPSRHSNAKRPYYLVKGFLDAGWEVDVFTSNLGVPEGEPELPPMAGLRVFRREAIIDRLMRKTKGHELLFRLTVYGITGLVWPDGYTWWSLRTLRAARRQAAYDRTLVFILPASLLLSGVFRGMAGPHWIFDYQESVIPQYRRQLRRSPLQRALLPLLEKLERHTLHKAARVVFTADTNRQTYIREGLVPEAATTHLPYFYDAEVFRDSATAISSNLEIVYFGTFDFRGARSPETFLHSLARFVAKYPDARSRTRFVFYGTWLAEHTRFVEELGLQEVVSIRGSVPHQDYLEKVKQSPVLLLVVSSAHNLFMPSKIVDYFGARRPILAFVPRASEMRGVLEQAGMADFVCDEFDVEAGVAALERLWQRHQSRTITASAEKTRFWSSETQIPRYLRLVKELRV